MRRRRLPWAFWLGAGWLGLVAGGALLADLLPLPDRDAMDFTALHQPPGRTAGHPLGTDAQGRDLLARVVHGARVSMVIGLCAPAISLVFGLAIGLLAGYYRGWVEGVIVMGLDTILALPGLVVLLLTAAVFGGSLKVVTLTVGLLGIPAFARVSRAATLSFAQREFVLAAKAVGARDARIIVLDILPNVALPVAAYALVFVGVVIVIEGALSFLGLSVPAPIPSWGGMIAEGREHLEESPYLSLIPALAMFLTVLSFNVVGDTVRSRVADVRESAL